MIWAGFLFGLLGSFHCVGMCGPIAMALPFNKSAGPVAYTTGRLLYNGGRVITYTLLGLLAGFFGKSLQLAGLQQSISIISGILILVLVVAPAGFSAKFRQKTGLEKVLVKVRQKLAFHFQQSSFKSLFAAGLLNGLLPCGFVYIALAGAVTGATLTDSMLYMFLFGLGTYPLMLLVSLSGKIIRFQFRKIINQYVPYVACFMAVVFILRGLNLGIPYLSPEVVKHEDKTVTMSCCHKPQFLVTLLHLALLAPSFCCPETNKPKRTP
jgi:uncharacterized protein